jgi:hypothetical protein
MTTTHKVLVSVAGLLLAVLGLRWMLAPAGIATEQGITLGTALALNTARGDLGGFFLGGAILCALGVRTGDGRWLQAVALVVGCVAFGRVVGMIADGVAAEAAVAFVVELGMIAVFLSAANAAGTQGIPR